MSILSFFLLCTSICTGQEGYVPVKVPAKYEKELDDAMLQFQGGNQKEAIKTIEGIVEKFPDWTKARQKLSRAYYESEQKQAAAAQLEASLAIDTMSQLNELYSLGRVYEEINEPERALACYVKVIKKATSEPALVQRATTSQQILEKKKGLWKKEGDIVFTPFDSDINTPQIEALGRWTLDGQKMVFTRQVFGQEDIFFASYDTTARIWSIEDFPYNSPLNEGALALSPDNNYLIFMSCERNDGLGGCDLYLSFKDKGRWSKPTNMGPSFNSISWDGHPCFGLDGLTLFFSSSRPGGMGGKDIWYVYQIAEGRWSNPINAGPAINTPDNEESPFVHFDGQTIYFMRDGKEGLGGYDLYISRKGIDGKWQKAENLGAPINSGVDEGALTLHPDGKRAIITRMTETAKDDLFEFVLPEKFRAAPTQALQVTIKDQVTGQPVRARVELFEISKQDTIRMSQWADLDGKISAVTSKEVGYGVMVSAEGYIMYSGKLEADTSAVRQLTIMMTPMTAAQEKAIVLQNVFFESGSAALLPTSEPELNKLLWTLRKNVNMQIEIRGHTDNEGDEKSNLALSEARAKAVYQYLAGRGITADRMSYKGFGETQPIADNATAAGRKQNRRTEFLITKM